MENYRHQASQQQDVPLFQRKPSAAILFQKRVTQCTASLDDMLMLNWYFPGKSPSSNVDDKIKQGVDDGSNIKATQQTAMPMAPVHWAVVRSEHVDFEAEVSISSTGCEMK